MRSEGNRWFDRNASVPIKPGDTIVVPLDTEHIPALPLWTQVTQILYNIAIAVLAVHDALTTVGGRARLRLCGRSTRQPCDSLPAQA